MLYRVIMITGLIALFSCTSPKQGALIEFKENEKTIGQIAITDTVRVQYYYTNTGDETLIVENVRVSCGCTSTKWTKEVKPGNTAELLLQYIPKEGEKGNIVKKAYINTNAGQAEVSFKVTI